MATCHLLSGATWPVSRHQSHCLTIGQRRSTVAVNGDQRRSTMANHRLPSPDNRLTTVGVPPDYRSMVVDCQSTGGSTVGSTGQIATWHHLAADVEIPKGAIASNSGPPEYKLKGCP
ncbi:hypothetical protein Tco_1040542 [Tanacetum coccineum]